MISPFVAPSRTRGNRRATNASVSVPATMRGCETRTGPREPTSNAANESTTIAIHQMKFRRWRVGRIDPPPPDPGSSSGGGGRRSGA